MRFRVLAKLITSPLARWRGGALAGHAIPLFPSPSPYPLFPSPCPPLLRPLSHPFASPYPPLSAPPLFPFPMSLPPRQSSFPFVCLDPHSHCGVRSLRNHSLYLSPVATLRHATPRYATLRHATPLRPTVRSASIPLPFSPLEMPRTTLAGPSELQISSNSLISERIEDE